MRLLILCAPLLLKTRPDQHSGVGGSVFNFLPFHVLGNITSQTKQKEFCFFSRIFFFFCHWPQCLSPSFHVSDFYSMLCGDIKMGRGGYVGVPYLPAGWMSRAARQPAPSTESGTPSALAGASCSLTDVQNVQ